MTDYSKYDSKLEITVHGVLLADPGHLIDVMRRCERYHDIASVITISCREAERDGSSTIVMHILYRAGGAITLGALRRRAGAETEFHS